MKKRKGFTMVELMVVIIIMAILGLAIMPALMGSSEKAKYSRAWSDLDAIANAFTAYYGKEGNLPALSDSDAAKDLDDEICEGTERSLLQSFLGTQLADLYDPWNERYQIKSTWNADTGKGYIVVYVKAEGTSGEDPGFAGITGITARVDPYSDSDSTLGGLPMAKLIINVI